jgi:hypothetical protein
MKRRIFGFCPHTHLSFIDGDYHETPKVEKKRSSREEIKKKRNVKNKLS